jgi:hypothetical protein
VGDRGAAGPERRGALYGRGGRFWGVTRWGDAPPRGRPTATRITPQQGSLLEGHPLGSPAGGKATPLVGWYGGKGMGGQGRRDMGGGTAAGKKEDCDRKVTEEADNRHTTHVHFATQIRKGVEGENGDTYRVGGIKGVGD